MHKLMTSGQLTRGIKDAWTWILLSSWASRKHRRPTLVSAPKNMSKMLNSNVHTAYDEMTSTSLPLRFTPSNPALVNTSASPKCLRHTFNPTLFRTACASPNCEKKHALSQIQDLRCRRRPTTPCQRWTSKRYSQILKAATQSESCNNTNKD